MLFEQFRLNILSNREKKAHGAIWCWNGFLVNG